MIYLQIDLYSAENHRISEKEFTDAICEAEENGADIYTNENGDVVYQFEEEMFIKVSV